MFFQSRQFQPSEQINASKWAPSKVTFPSESIPNHWLSRLKENTKKLPNLIHVLPLVFLKSAIYSFKKTASDLATIDNLIHQTNEVFNDIAKQSTKNIATQEAIDFSKLADLSKPGKFTWRKEKILFQEANCVNKTTAEVYLPQVSHPAPVIVISPGLIARENHLEYLAKILVSHGFVVTIAGSNNSNNSNSELLWSYITNGVASDNKAEPQEFINRVLRIKHLLDELQRRSQSDPNFKVNAQQVGIVGVSFGGYTALALAGGTINFDKLQNDCKNVKSNSVNSSLSNLSLLLQCRALDLPQQEYELHDERVKAVMLINPVNGSLFGEEGLSNIRIPVMYISSSDDILAPALTEQILPFKSLKNKQKYLVTLRGGTHFSISSETNSTSNPAISLARRYTKALGVAFFQTHVVEAKEYQPFLSSAYAKFISQEPLQVHLVHSLEDTNQIKLVSFSETQHKIKWFLPAYKNFLDYLNG